MDDYRLILNNLELSGRAKDLDRSWVFRWYIMTFVFAPALLIFALSANAEESKLLILSGQFALALGTFQALSQLSRRPLLNPIQAVVFLFHWWFSVGPAVAVLFARMRDDGDLFEKYVATGGEALWIVAVGLPIYAFFANMTIRWSRGRIRHLNFLMPEGPLYQPRTLYAYWLVGGAMTLIIAGFGQIGIVGSQTINYLGGKVSENWFVSSLETISTISVFATIGVLAYLAGPVQRNSGRFKAIAIGLIAFNTVTAFTSGWKGAIMQGFVLLVIVMYTWRQKMHGILVIVFALSYLFVIEPFVSQVRLAAELAQITTTEERVELFNMALDEGLSLRNLLDQEVKIETPFRGVYEFATTITSDSSSFEGPWSGTISEGALALVPRAIYPDKPEGHIGNYMARYLGNAAPDNYEQSVGVSIPFEVLGNYGRAAGIFTFVLIGILWTALCVWLLSEDRLATHPMAPLIIIYSLSMESSIGAFLARLRDLPLVLGTAYVVWLTLKRRL